MRCAACGYHNLPGTTSCARCGGGAEARAAAAGSSFAEVYPPRARRRPILVRLAETVGGQAAAFRDRLPLAELRQRRVEAARASRHLTLGGLSLLPGLGQLCQRRFAVGAAMAAGGLLLTAGAVRWLHHRLSDFLLLLLFGLTWYSVSDALIAGAPASSPPDGRRLRTLRYSLVALGLITGSVTSFGLALMPWYSFWRMGTTVPGIPLRVGDGLIIRRVSRAASLRVGDTVVFRDRNGWETIGTVCALPGQSLPASAAPPRGLIWAAGGLGPNLALERTESALVVPRGEVGVTVPVMWADGNGRTVARVRARELEGRIAGIYAPAERRRWYR